MSETFFNVQTVDPGTGDEQWVTVRAADADSAREAAAARGAVVGEVRAADPRVDQHAVAEEEYDPLPIEAQTESHASEKCGVCGAPMGADSNVCGLCAFDKRKGIQSSTLVRTVDAGDGERGRRIVACKECGYDLSGLPTAKCPECGTNNIRKHDLLEGVSEETEQAAFRTPIIAIAVGFGVTFGVVGIAWGQAGLLASLILLALTLPVALVVVSLCLIIWIGVDSTWKLTLLQITGAAALSVLGVCVCAGLAAVFGFPSGMAIVPCMVIGFFCLIASLAWMLDLELTDAALTGVFTSIIIIGELLLLWTR